VEELFLQVNHAVDVDGTLDMTGPELVVEPAVNDDDMVDFGLESVCQSAR